MKLHTGDRLHDMIAVPAFVYISHHVRCGFLTRRQHYHDLSPTRITPNILIIGLLDNRLYCLMFQILRPCLEVGNLGYGELMSIDACAVGLVRIDRPLACQRMLHLTSIKSAYVVNLPRRRPTVPLVRLALPIRPTQGRPLCPGSIQYRQSLRGEMSWAGERKYYSLK